MKNNLFLFDIFYTFFLIIFSIFIGNITYILFLLTLFLILNLIFFISFNTFAKKEAKIENETDKKDLLKNLKQEIDNIIKKIIEEYGVYKLKNVEKFIGEIEDIENIKRIFLESLNELSKVYVDERKEKFDIIKNSLCPICFANEIIMEFENYSKQNIRKNMTDIINLLEHIKQEQNQSYHQILGIITDFTKRIEEGKTTEFKNNENLNYVFSQTQKIQSDIAETINNYYSEFKRINLACKEIEEISEKIRMITLNLSIEASKSNNKAFNVISHELQKLSLKTQDFVKNIMSNIKKSIENIELQKESKLMEIKEVNEQIEKARIINEEFEKTMKGIYELVDKLSDTVNVFIEDKKNIFSVFENIQNVQIDSEIIEHFFRLINETIFSNTDKVHEILGGKKGACEDIPFKKVIIKDTLEKLEKIVTTEKERELVKILYKKYLDIENTEKSDMTKEGVILF
ncbi:MAG: hypothetical protein N2258_00385 [Brevinematales bacterium]|nr:hypothetical protein [Brevinematales bacterium]